MSYQTIVDSDRTLLNTLPSEPTLAHQALSTLQGDLHQQLLTIATHVHYTNRHIDILKERERIARKRRQHLEDTVNLLREYCLQCLIKLNLKSIENTDIQVKIVENRPCVTIDNISLIPAMYIARIEPHPDKAQIRHSLMQGTQIPGARLVYGSHVIITPMK